MIKKIKLQNFQSHLNNEIEFVEGINIIIGSSNSGKSSIIKAINWNINNAPAGLEIINHNENECKVKLNIENNEIGKVKSKDGKNDYVINDNELKSVGQNVPKEIFDLTNFNFLNMQMQFDKFFLLQDSPGEIARILNKIINLEIIDQSIKNIKSKVNKKSQDIQYLENDILDIKNKIKKFDDLDQFERLVIEGEKFEIEKEKIEKKINSIKLYKQQLNDYKIELSKYENIDKQKKVLIELKKLKIEYENKIDRLNQIKQLKNDYLSCQVELKKYDDLKNKKNLLQFLENDIIIYRQKIEKLELLKEFKNNKIELSSLDKLILEKKIERDKLLNTIDYCPFHKKVCPLR